MKRLPKNKFAALLAAFILGSSVQLFAAPEPNEQAPDFSLSDANGKVHKLSDYRGKVVVLEWTNAECPFVVRHYDAKTMTTLAGKFDSKKVVWLAVDSSHHRDSAMNQKWAKERQIKYPILMDSEGKVGQLYGAKTTPHMFVIDSEGKLVYKGAIDNDSWGKNKGSDLVNHVDAAVTATLAGKKPDTAQTKPYGCSVKYK